MAKTKIKSDPVKFATPRDPNHCFVLFPVGTYFNALTVGVGLESLLRQVQHVHRDKPVKRMEYIPQENKLIIDFEESDGS
ncbi:hypothetical protein [Paenibacillus naphthalenovorans]|uniref:hypothetical protein n=1 Tax=Paenibacillus naphthalenovorans TaxID=162209 RepID=UPI0009422834|nr:hypothetical protein [Paenibacillus naphthalenovorans]